MVQMEFKIITRGSGIDRKKRIVGRELLEIKARIGEIPALSCTVPPLPIYTTILCDSLKFCFYHPLLLWTCYVLLNDKGFYGAKMSSSFIWLVIFWRPHHHFLKIIFLLSIFSMSIMLTFYYQLIWSSRISPYFR